MKRRKMSALQRKYFGKGKKSRVTKTRTKYKTVYKMAKRRGGFRRGGSRGGLGGMKTMIAPVIGGLADSVIDGISPVDGLGGAITGFVLKSNTTRDIGLYKVGFSLGNILPIPKLGGIGGSSGGFA